MDLLVININTLNTTFWQLQSPQACLTSAIKKEEQRIIGKCVRCGSFNYWINYCLLAPAKDYLQSPQVCQKFTARRESDNMIVSDTELEGSFKEHQQERLFSPQYSALEGGSVTAGCLTSMDFGCTSVDGSRLFRLCT